MAQFVSVSIDISGKSIKQFSAFSLAQGIFEHHTFRLVCPTEAIDGTSGDLFSTSKDMIGGTITVKVDSVGGSGSLQFSGVITQVKAARFSGHAGDLIIEGFSPTVIMDNGSHCKTWEKQTLKAIAGDVVSHFPQNLIQPKISPNNGDTLSYVVQYMESAWQFLRRQCSRYGEWLFYDGQKLIVGNPQGAKTKLVYGSDLQYFDMAVQVQPANFQIMAYDYMNDEVYTGSPQGIDNKAGLNDLGKHALQKSQQFYGAQPKQWHNQFLTSKKQLDDFVDIQGAVAGSSMVHFNGGSDQPGVQVGGTVSVQGKNVFDQSDKSYGDYLVVGVTHHLDGQGNYSNVFVAVPATIKVPPVADLPDPRCETQSALVTDNHDPKGLARIRVRFRWMATSEKSPWLRVAGAHGGSGKGMFFIPEVGEEVLVGFEGDDAEKAYVIGSVYNANAKTTFSNDSNDIKTIQTRTGNKVVMNDKDGSVIVADQNDNKVKLDGSGNINISSSESIVLAVGNSTISMKKDGTIEITGKTVSLIGTDKATVGSGSASFVADGQQNSAEIDGDKVTMDGQQEVDVKGMKISIAADTQAELKGLNVSLSGSAMIKAQGGVIMLN